MNATFSRQLAAIVSAIWIMAPSADANIMSKEERAQAFELARSLVDRSVAPVEADRLALAPAPFSRNLGIEKAVAENPRSARSVVSPADLLPKLAHQLNPTGIFVFGGEYYLVFKEKKVKAGAAVAVPYENNEYTVVISDIRHTHYTVAYGGSELQLKLK